MKDGRLLRVLLAAGTLAGGLAFGAVGASGASASASDLIASINSTRAANGLPPLSIAGDLTSVASSHSAAMAASHSLYHNPSLASAVCCWSLIGENVGEGPSTGSIAAAFLASPEHRANILSAFTQVGIGVSTSSDGTVWVTEDFRRPMQAAPPPPAPPPAPAPAPSRITTPPSHVPPAAPAVRVPPQPSPSPMLARLSLAKHSAVATGDPLARALGYVRVMKVLTSG